MLTDNRISYFISQLTSIRLVFYDTHIILVCQMVSFEVDYAALDRQLVLIQRLIVVDAQVSNIVLST